MSSVSSTQLKQYLKERNVIPYSLNDINDPAQRELLNNTQGDFLLLFPKVKKASSSLPPSIVDVRQEFENFIFFTIGDAKKFRTALGQIKPTTSQDVLNNLGEVCKKKMAKTTNWDRVDLKQIQIAFSRKGLDFLGVKEMTKDLLFDKASMRSGKKDLGSTGDWDDVFDSAGTVHGVVIVAANCE
jgi:hypothetical protein